MKSKWCAGVFFIFVGLLVASSTDANVPTNRPAAVASVVLVGAGDIADCKDLSGAEATAKLLEQIPGTVMAVGDLAYPDGTKENFACYEKTWGRVRSRTRPAAGNHEFHSAGAPVYFDYFGAAAGAEVRLLQLRTGKLAQYRAEQRVRTYWRLRRDFTAGTMVSRGCAADP